MPERLSQCLTDMGETPRHFTCHHQVEDFATLERLLARAGEWAEALAAEARESGARVLLAGLSRGGVVAPAVAARLLRRFPELSVSVLMLSPAFAPPPGGRPQRQMRLIAGAGRLAGAVPEGLARLGIPGVLLVNECATGACFAEYRLTEGLADVLAAARRDPLGHVRRMTAEYGLLDQDPRPLQDEGRHWLRELRHATRRGKGRVMLALADEDRSVDTDWIANYVSSECPNAEIWWVVGAGHALGRGDHPDPGQLFRAFLDARVDGPDEVVFGCGAVLRRHDGRPHCRVTGDGLGTWALAFAWFMVLGLRQRSLEVAVGGLGVVVLACKGLAEFVVCQVRRVGDPARRTLRRSAMGIPVVRELLALVSLKRAPKDGGGLLPDEQDVSAPAAEARGERDQ